MRRRENGDGDGTLADAETDSWPSGSTRDAAAIGLTETDGGSEGLSVVAGYLRDIRPTEQATEEEKRY